MDVTTVGIGAAVLAAVAASCFVSASAGLGGSLILVPTLALVLGTKEGVALAALLLAANNVVKVVAYRGVLPWRSAAGVALLTAAGAVVGARLLVAASERAVALAVIASFAAALLAERRWSPSVRRSLAPGLALAAGATSGFSGTSGPLKGVAIRRLDLDRFHTVGAAALVSLVGDATKVTVFTDASLLDGASFRLAVLAVPLMVASTLAGRRWNRRLGERGYQRFFWVVIGGYTARLVAGAA